MDFTTEIQQREQESGHCVFGPSQIERIMLCPASFQETLRQPIQESGAAAQRGTMLHDVVAECISWARQQQPWDNARSYTTLKEDTDKYAIRDCIDFLLPFIESAAPNTIKIESEVSLEGWGLPQIYGTADFSCVMANDAELVVVDWKFGGTPVYVERNPQLYCYAMGALGTPVGHNGNTKVTVAVGQPALDYFETHTTTVDELIGFSDDLAHALENAVYTHPDYNPGKKQCQFCAVKAKCGPRIEQAKTSGRKLFKLALDLKSDEGLVPNIPVAELVSIVDELKQVEDVAKDIRKFLHKEILRGGTVPGKKLVHGRSSRNFKNPKGAIQWLMQQGIKQTDLYAPLKPLSVAQVEKKFKQFKKDEDFLELWEKKPGKLQMVDESDPRPAYANDAKTVFKRRSRGSDT